MQEPITKKKVTASGDYLNIHSMPSTSKAAIDQEEDNPIPFQSISECEEPTSSHGDGDTSIIKHQYHGLPQKHRNLVLRRLLEPCLNLKKEDRNMRKSQKPLLILSARTTCHLV